MPKFRYKARDTRGRVVNETIHAPSEAVARDMLSDKQLIVVFIEEEDKDVFEQLSHITEHVAAKDLVIFSRQLSVLVSATVPIVRALRILAKQTESKTLQKIVASIADEVDGGARLSSAMHKHNNVFDDFFVYMIRSGETTGRLDEVLTYLADQKEKDYQLVSRIISAMIYPAFIVVVLIGMFVFMMVYVVPKLLEVVTSTGAELPLPTRILIATSDFFQHSWWVILVVGALIIVGYAVARTQPKSKKVLDRLKLYIPIIGNIFRKVYLARISRSMSNLLSAGVPVNRSIEIVSDVVNNAVYQEILVATQLEIEAGHAMSSALKNYRQIPPMMVQMMDIGEETGRLDQILAKVGDFYSNEVESLTNALASLVEPIIIILLGMGALVLVTGVLMPIYSITAQF